MDIFVTVRFILNITAVNCRSAKWRLYKLDVDCRFFIGRRNRNATGAAQTVDGLGRRRRGGRRGAGQPARRRGTGRRRRRRRQPHRPAAARHGEPAGTHTLSLSLCLFLIFFTFIDLSAGTRKPSNEAKETKKKTFGNAGRRQPTNQQTRKRRTNTRASFFLLTHIDRTSRRRRSSRGQLLICSRRKGRLTSRWWAIDLRSIKGRLPPATRCDRLAFVCLFFFWPERHPTRAPRWMHSVQLGTKLGSKKNSVKTRYTGLRGRADPGRRLDRSNSFSNLVSVNKCLW